MYHSVSRQNTKLLRESLCLINPNCHSKSEQTSTFNIQLVSLCREINQPMQENSAGPNHFTCMAQYSPRCFEFELFFIAFPTELVGVPFNLLHYLLWGTLLPRGGFLLELLQFGCLVWMTVSYPLSVGISRPLVRI